VPYEVRLKKQAQKDLIRLRQAGLSEKALALAKIMEEDPHRPPHEKLGGNLKGYYSRRINVQHRIAYEVDEESRKVWILRMWTHYEW